MTPILFLLWWLVEAIAIVLFLLLLEWLRARRGHGRSTELRIGVYRDDPPTDENGDGE